MAAVTKAHLTTRERSIIKNLDVFFTQLKIDLKSELRKNKKKLKSHPVLQKYNKIQSNIASIIGISTRQLKKLIKLVPDAEESTEQKNKNIGRKPIECDEYIQTFIKKTVLDFYINKEYPTIIAIRNKCLENPMFPKVSKTVFYKWLTKKCNLKFKKINKKPVYLEKGYIQLQREVYLNRAQELRNDGYYFIYTDETWCSLDQSPDKCWHLRLSDDEIKEFQEITKETVLQNIHGETGGFKVKGGAGRIIINHAGGKDGFVQNMEDVFRSKKDSRDYHSCMNQKHWTEWFKKLLENAPNKSVIVVDQAPYHRETVPDTVMAKKSWRKPRIIENLKLRGVPLPEGVASYEKLTIPALIALSAQFPVKLKFVIKELAEKCSKDIKVIWLPVAHCEFNAIEMVWSNVKRYCAKNNKTGGVDVLDVVKESLNKITPELWTAFCDKAIEYEDIMRKRDGLIEDILYNNIGQNNDIGNNDNNNNYSNDDEDMEVDEDSSSEDSSTETSSSDESNSEESEDNDDCIGTFFFHLNLSKLQNLVFISFFFGSLGFVL